MIITKNNSKELTGWERLYVNSKKCCNKCGAPITEKGHDCNKEIGHLCFMRPLRNKLPASDTVLLVYYDFETAQDTKHLNSVTVHVQNLVCLQQFCSKCREHSKYRLEQCVRWKHKICDDPLGDLLTYLRKSRPW